LQGKEYDDEADDGTSVKTHREKIVVLYPPAVVEAPHEPLEGETNQDPQCEVDAIGRWDTVSGNQCNRDVDVAPEQAGVAMGKVVERDW